ncbi:MAG TPA: phytoene/squalene synthase family protein [Candidatus Omnitrophota bacterium]|nr:phytoene/squalene synthase family protein [Candidatus Omnitrophota bacterium]HPN56251.1 phytoene/squalene synthase family protein [Candidatus Omnitrophota bacterium]
MDLYLKTCHRISRLLTNRYSTSFSSGIKVFPQETQQAIYGLYGFVRVADEIVDTFHDYDKKRLLEKFKEDTAEAIRSGVSTNPILESFQDVVHKYKIDQSYVQAFLTSMDMDITYKTHSQESYERYVYGSAEVIGLMCLEIFCSGDDALFRDLEVPAKKLGAALQKTNFLRDIKNDLEERGRIYLPGIKDRPSIDEEAKKRMEAEIAEEFKEALPGIKRMPKDYRLAVYSVYLYYVALFKRIRKLPVATLLRARIRISDFHKLLLLLKGYFIVHILWGGFRLKKRGLQGGRRTGHLHRVNPAS